MPLYIPTYFSPRNITIDPSIDTTMTCQINGTICVAYDITIRKISDNSITYNSTKITLSEPLYDKDTSTHSLPSSTLTAGTDYKWTIKVYSDSTNYVESGEIPFSAYATPVLSLTVPSTITSQSHEFICTYTHPQDIGIKQFTSILYDVNDNIILRTPYKYSANVRNTFDGFINSTTYKVEFIAEDLNGIIVSTGKKTFDISYSSPSLIVVPETELLPEKSAIKITWTGAVQITGEVTGTSLYVEDHLIDDNYGLQLDEGSILEYDVDIPLEFTTTFLCLLPQGFEGIICQLDDNYSIGYEDGKFYFDNKGIIEYGLSMEITDNPFLIAIRPTDIYIKYYEIYHLWNEYKNVSWQQIFFKKWDEIKDI